MKKFGFAALLLAVIWGISGNGQSDLVEDEKRAVLMAPASARPLVVIGSRVNVRAGPSVGDDILTTYAKGRLVSVLSSKGDWSEVALRTGTGQSGWMASRFLATSVPLKPTPVVAPKPPNKRSIAAPTARDITTARKTLIRQSIAAYPGTCPCPYNRDRAGRSCGGRSAWSRPGGYSPICYESDVSANLLKTYFARQRGATSP